MSDPLLTALLLAAVLLGALLPLAVAMRRQRRLRRAVARADLAVLAALARPAVAPRRSHGALLDYLEQAPDELLFRLGDAAQTSPHRFARPLFEEVYRIVTERERARRRELRRRTHWQALRDGAGDGTLPEA